MSSFVLAVAAAWVAIILGDFFNAWAPRVARLLLRLGSALLPSVCRWPVLRAARTVLEVPDALTQLGTSLVLLALALPTKVISLSLLVLGDRHATQEAVRADMLHVMLGLGLLFGVATVTNSLHQAGLPNVPSVDLAVYIAIPVGVLRIASLGFAFMFLGPGRPPARTGA